jgi:amino acid adenylation domain-containing protein
MDKTWNKVIELLLEARSQGVDIMLQDGQLRLKVSKGEAVNPALLQQIREDKNALVEFLASENQETPGEATPIPPADRSAGPLPLSYAQERLWFIDQFNGSQQYHLPWVFRLEGEVDTQALEASFREIVSRHEVLRTLIRNNDGIGLQETLSFSNWSMTKVKDEDGSASSGIESFIARPFNLSDEPMLRVMLASRSAKEHTLVIVLHHIAFDGWSINIMVNELCVLYGSYTKQLKPELPQLPIQYADYAAWQRETLSGEAMEERLSYWKNLLAGVEPLDLLTDHPRPVEPGVTGGVVERTLDASTRSALVKLANREGATLYMVLLSVFKVLLHRYSGQTDICVGMPIAGRNRPELQELIGFFVNTLALRSNLQNDPTFREVLHNMKSLLLDAFRYQDTPFEKVVEALGVERDMSRNPVFQVMFSLQNDAGQTAPRLDGIELVPAGHAHITAKIDLHLNIAESPEGLTLSMVYNTDLYVEDTIRRLLDHYTALLDAILSDGLDKSIGRLKMLSRHEEEQLLLGFNDTGLSYPEGLTVVHLFEEHASGQPTAPALSFEEEQLTYAELDERANCVANYLRENGVEKGHFVAVCMDRCTDIVVAMLGILKSGGAYVPIDPSYPASRIEYMLRDTGAGIVLTQSSYTALIENAGRKVVCMDTEWSTISERSSLATGLPLLGNDLAYVIYTSGSTGLPKGVMIPHSALANLVRWHHWQYEVLPESRATAMAGIGFDAFGWELWPYLSAGASVHIPGENERLSIRGLLDFFDTKQVTHSFIATALAAELVEASRNRPMSLRWLLTGGDRLPPVSMKGISYRLVNNYGPTENTVVATSFIIEGSKGDALPLIGRPVSNAQAYILDSHLQPVPIGVAGELCISGAQVAKGYLNLPELTAEKFIDHPIDPAYRKNNSKLYRTGDKARWLADGNLEFLGRIDDQVKIRGYRIEPGEIEQLLRQAGSVKQAVVLLHEDRLVAYVVPADRFSKEDALLYLGNRLPSYMVPSALVEIEAIPLTSNGKADRKKLLEMAAPPSSTREYQAPRNTTEELLAGIWQELMGIKQIGINDNFFELGGHSLLAMRLASALRKATGKELGVRKIFANPTIASLALQLQPGQEDAVLPDIEKYPLQENIPLSFEQERLWFIHRLQGSTQYHIPWVLRLKGDLDIKLLEDSLREIVNRHQVLRTVLKEIDGISYQHIVPADGWKLHMARQEDILATSASLQSYIEELVTQPFNLALDSPLRVTLVRLSATEYILVGVVHHIAFDGWSVSILVNELVQLYSSGKAGSSAALKELPVQYADYAIWQRRFLSGQLLERKLSYWKQKLNAVEPLALLTDFVRPPEQSVRGAFVSTMLSKETLDSLYKFSQREGVTFFMTVLSTFKLLLHRYTGQSDICVGTPVAGRGQQELEGLIGFFLNTLALRSELRPSDSFRSLLRQVRQTTLEAYEHQDTPFEKIVEVLNVERDRSRNAVFQVWLVLQNMPAADSLNLGGVELTSGHPGTLTSQFDLNLDISEKPDGLQLSLTYCVDLFREETVQRMLNHYVNLLQAATADAEASLGTLPMLDGVEEKQVLEEFNATAADYPSGKTLVDLFEWQAAETPGATALVFEEISLSYAELNERSNRLAHCLLAKGARSEDLVGICLDRGVEMIVSILAILKAGCAYVPMDPGYPGQRLHYMMEDSNCRLVLVTQDHEGLLPAGVEPVDPASNLLAGYPAINPGTGLHSSNLAYVIYTSGSTGKPKGVLVEHGSVVNLITAQTKAFGITAAEKILQFSSYCFDASVEQVFLALLNGAELVMIPKKLLLERKLFEQMLYDRNITHLHATPGFLDLLEPGRYGGLKRVIAGGELCPASLAARWSKLVNFYNEYGPTETTVTAIELLASGPAAAEALPIGKPLANTRAYVLDAWGHPVGIGVPGELYISGVQVARGYLEREELTLEKFRPDPFAKEPGQRMYRTGDLARWLPDGNLEFLGRMDDQVKIRGYRIELGEVEAVLQQTPGIRQAVVLVHEEGADKKLVAYAVGDEGFVREAVLDWLKLRLPDYMLPAVLVEVDEIPLNPNGKVDRKKLLNMAVPTAAPKHYEAARTETERVLVSIWEELLETEPIGIHDNFFELGGHSLLAVRVAAAVRSRLEKEIAIVALFEYPTIALLATQLPASSNESLLPPIGKYPREDRSIPLSFAQERLWFIDSLQGSIQYHMPWIFRLSGQLDTAALEASFQRIIDRHEVLRTVIHEEDGLGCQVVLSSGSWSMQYMEKEEILASGESLGDYVEALLQKPYNLSEDTALRVCVIRISDDEHLLVVLIHHIAFDGWSISLVVKELAELYNSIKEQRPAMLKELPVQYADYSCWQREYLSGEILDAKLSYWKSRLTGVEPLELPLDYPRPAMQSTRGSTLVFRIEKELVDRLNVLSQKQGATLFMTALAAFKVMLYRYTGQHDICVGTPVANRIQESTDALVGFFVNTLVLRDDLSGDPDFLSLLAQVKSTALEAFTHQDTPFEKIVEEVVVERSMNYTPLFQVLFALQNTPEIGELKLSGLTLESEPLTNTTSRFDLYVDLVETPDGLQVQVEYCTDLFHAKTIERMFGHYRRLLLSAVEEPAQKISRLRMLTAEEERQLKSFNDTEAHYPAEKSITGMFEEQAAATPHTVAIMFDGAGITYEVLNERSNLLANYLLAQGLAPGSLAIICVERSVDMIAGVIAILKAGCTYVPVDPRYPKERIDFMLQDSDAPVVLTSSACSHIVRKGGRMVIEVDGDWENIAKSGKGNPGINVSPETPAYVIYTSGSTGKPKGVELPRRALRNLLLWQNGQEEQKTGSHVLQFASLNFDVSFQEIFSSLCFGNTLHLIEEDRRRDMQELVGDIITQHINRLFIPYVVLKNIAEYTAASGKYPQSLREIFTAGEQLKLTDDIKLLVEKTGLKLYNQYGPSEAHVVSAYEVQPQDYYERPLPPVGSPVANTQLYVLGPGHELCGIGIPGQLVIGGIQVARGYLNRPELTAAKFIPDHISGREGGMLYCTGDKARWLPDGNIEFLGRMDDQVKIRGYRIELGEVEAALLQAPGVKQAVMMAREDAQGIKRLVAYVSGVEELDREVLRDHLKSRLPEYMVPALLVSVESMPMTANGKVDKRKLPDPDLSQMASSTYEAPRNETEEKVVAIWQELLGVQRIGIHDNFFEAGGHSLLVTRMASLIRKEFDIDLPVRTFFQLATPEAIAACIQVNQLQASYDSDNYETIEL